MKSSLENDSIRIQHMLDAALRAQHYLHGKTRLDFEADEILSLAMTRLMEIIGEAATHVAEATRTKHPAVPWQPAISMHNRVIHGYFNVDYGIVWDTVSENIPPLIAALQTILETLPSLTRPQE